mmetsp:Transcript_32017/g.97684  ORF Transcript_32017/g.97684 Transcript_32017/m.97684 type:complete len:114 (+) Transcript_32017:148-489(+)
MVEAESDRASVGCGADGGGEEIAAASAEQVKVPLAVGAERSQDRGILGVFSPESVRDTDGEAPAEGGKDCDVVAAGGESAGQASGRIGGEVPRDEEGNGKASSDVGGVGGRVQ